MSLAIARASALFALLALLAPYAWTLLAAAPAPAWLLPPAGLRLALLPLAPAIWLAAHGGLPMARMLGACTLGLSAILIGAGIFAGDARSEQAGFAPGVIATLGIGVLGASLWLRDAASGDFDGSAGLGTIAAGLFFLNLAGQLYDAPTLMAAGRGGTLGALVLLALALGALASHAGGPLADYEGEGPGAVARRRLLPAAVLTPVASGFLLLYAIGSRDLSPALAVAITVAANVMVMLHLIHRAGRRVARVAQAGEARLQAREAAAKKQGMRESMTGLLNRRGWTEVVSAGERRCRTEKLDAGVIVIDLDGLKRVNDAQGHAAGDALIQGAARALKKAARRGDALARLGGDEFSALVLGCDEATVKAVVARFDQALRAAQVSASLGYAMRGTRTLTAAFEEADQAMYQHKRARKQKRG